MVGHYDPEKSVYGISSYYITKNLKKAKTHPSTRKCMLTSSFRIVKVLFIKNVKGTTINLYSYMEAQNKYKHRINRVRTNDKPLFL